MTAAQTLLDAAHAWHAAGYTVLPAANDGTKRPGLASWKQYQTKQPALDELDRMLNGADGIGIVCGTTGNNIEMFEAEARAVNEGSVTALEQAFTDHGLNDLWRRVSTGYAEITPSGGMHWYYNVDGPARANTKLARRPSTPDELAEHQADELTKAEHIQDAALRSARIEKINALTAIQLPQVLIETRGAGGWTVTAPSAGRTHPTGQAWIAITGTPATIPTLTVDERDTLHAIAATLDAMPTLGHQAPLPAAPTTGVLAAISSGQDTAQPGSIKPGDDYNTKATWDQILTPRGWACAGRLGKGLAWVRPGKNTRDGISATTGQAADGIDRLYVFSSSTEFETETPYSKFAAFALLEHDGDYSAAASTLRKAGYGTPPPVRHINTAPSINPPTRDTPRTDGNLAVAPMPAPAGRTVAASDDGNAQTLIDTYGHIIRYCHERGRWYAWDQNRWKPQPSKGGVVREYAKEIARSLPTDNKTEAAWQQRSLSAIGITNCLQQAETDPRIIIDIDEFDARPWELNTPGGIVNLATGELSPSNPEALHTRLTACTPNPDADPTTWLDFLNVTFNSDTEIISYMQRLFGYSATGYIGPHVLPFCFGSGGNGKGVTLETIAGILGDYATSSPNGFLMEHNYSQHETELARLSGSRFVICSEVNERDKFNEAKVKNLTGGDTITARFMRQDHFTFRPTHHLWLMGNHKPAVTSGGDGFWRRCRLIPFLHSVPDDKKVDGLQDKLIDQHAPAILAWVIKGAVDFHTGGLREPASIKRATQEYAHDQDTVARFVEDCCHLAVGQDSVRIPTAALQNAYLKWCDDTGETPVSAKRLSTDVVTRFGAQPRRSNGRRFLTGITILPTEAEADDAGKWWDK